MSLYQSVSIDLQGNNLLRTMLCFSTFPLLMLLAALYIKPSLSWEIPSPEFLESFTSELKSDGIMFVLPEDKSHNWLIVSQIKQLR